MYFWHSVGNKMLDPGHEHPVRYHADRYGNLLQGLHRATSRAGCDIRSNRWGIDPEITAKILRMGNRIYEVPISYTGREIWEGKKISWKDGIAVVGTLLRYRFLK